MSKKNIAVVDKGNFLFEWVKKVEAGLDYFYNDFYQKLPNKAKGKLFVGTRSLVHIDLESMKAYWHVGMNTINIEIKKAVSLFFNGTRAEKLIFPLDGGINTEERKEIIKTLAKICEQSPN